MHVFTPANLQIQRWGEGLAANGSAVGTKENGLQFPAGIFTLFDGHVI